MVDIALPFTVHVCGDRGALSMWIIVDLALAVMAMGRNGCTSEYQLSIDKGPVTHQTFLQRSPTPVIFVARRGLFNEMLADFFSLPLAIRCIHLANVKDGAVRAPTYRSAHE